MSTITLPTRDFAGIYEFVPGLTFQWLFDGRGVAYTLSGADRTVIDRYIDATRAVGSIWPQSLPYLALHDITDFQLTPHLRMRAREAVAIDSPVRSLTAIVIKKTVMGQAMRFFFNTEMLRLSTDRTARIFYRRSQAINWLQQQLGTGPLRQIHM